MRIPTDCNFYPHDINRKHGLILNLFKLFILNKLYPLQTKALNLGLVFLKHNLNIFF